MRDDAVLRRALPLGRGLAQRRDRNSFKIGGWVDHVTPYVVSLKGQGLKVRQRITSKSVISQNNQL